MTLVRGQTSLAFGLKKVLTSLYHSFGVNSTECWRQLYIVLTSTLMAGRTANPICPRSNPFLSTQGFRSGHRRILCLMRERFRIVRILKELAPCGGRERPGGAERMSSCQMNMDIIMRTAGAKALGEGCRPTRRGIIVRETEMEDCAIVQMCKSGIGQ